jgi:hypothetical protein
MTRFTLALIGCAVLVGVTGQGLTAEHASCPTTLAPEHPFAEPSPSSASHFWFGSEALAVLLDGSGTWQYPSDQPIGDPERFRLRARHGRGSRRDDGRSGRDFVGEDLGPAPRGELTDQALGMRR